MSGGTAIVPSTLAEIHALRDAGDDAYWSAPVQAAELALVEEERRPERRAIVALERMKREVGDWSTLAATFDELPEGVHQAVADEVLAGVPVWPEPALWEVQTNFRTLQEGQELMRAWGSDAPIKLGIVRERMWRIKERLNDADDAALGEWFDALEPAEVKAVLALLAGPA